MFCFSVWRVLCGALFAVCCSLRVALCVVCVVLSIVCSFLFDLSCTYRVLCVVGSCLRLCGLSYVVCGGWCVLECGNIQWRRLSL